MTKQTPLPKKEFFVICTMLFTESVAGTILFPFVSFMVASFGITNDERELGYYAGYLASSYFFAQFISSFFLGWLSDRVGRKPIMLLGTVATGVSCVLFGFSGSYYMAIGSRMIGGFLNSNWAVGKSYAGSITDSSNKSNAFSLIALVNGIGTIMGPVLGGLTAEPTTNPVLQYIFKKGTIWETYPYALPALIVVIFSVISVVSTLILMKEKPTYHQLENIELKPISEETSLPKKASLSEINNETEELLPSHTIEDDEEEPITNSVALEEEEEDESLPVIEEVKAEPPQGYAVLKRKPVIILIIEYMIISICFIVFDEVMPLWSLTSPSVGGLGFRSTHIGSGLAITGVSLILFQLLCFPKMSKKLGSIACFRIGSISSIFVFAGLPLANFVALSPSYVLWAVVGFFMVGRAVSGTLGFTTLNILLAEVAPSDIGTVNGVSVSFAGLVRAIGPAFGGNLYAWSATNGLSFPVDFHFTFLILAIGGVMSFLLSFSYKQKSVTHDKDVNITIVE